MRTIVIGDIHGAAKALQQVLDRSNFNPKVDRLVQIGDVADGWSEVPECVEILLDIQRKATPETMPVFIRGNHDIWAKDWILYGQFFPVWQPQGGQATVDAYVKTGLLSNPEHSKFWTDQVDWWIDENNNLFIHGGWDYKEGFPEGAKLKVNAGIGAMECHWDRSLLYGTKSGRTNGFKPLQAFNKVFIGHTAEDSGIPLNILNLWNVDTGAGWRGKLTAMDIDTEQYWQSDNVKELYSDEVGRR